jgi:hypothetical protein
LSFIERDYVQIEPPKGQVKQYKKKALNTKLTMKQVKKLIRKATKARKAKKAGKSRKPRPVEG